MAINKKLIHFKTKQKFNEELAKGNILSTSIVFILDTTEIYTHGLFYDGSKVDLSNIEASIQNILDDNLIWVKVEGEAGVRLKGTNGTATGNLAISAGDDKTASDGTLFTSEASGDHAVAFGYGNTCAGRTTLAQGLYNTVNGKDSVAFGQRNLVSGDQAFAAGQQNEVTSRLGVAIGYKNKATNIDSIALGYQNTSSGSGSIAMGDTCEATGTSSTTMGYNTKAIGAYSATFGKNTQATNEGEVSMGIYNKSTTSTDASELTMFSFGIGTSDTKRSNAIEIKKNGDVYIGDKLLTDEYITKDNATATYLPKGNYVITQDTTETVEDVETNTYVKYVALTLTEELKALVRENIGVNNQVTVDLSNYYTKEEIDTKIGDINTILESIINGVPNIITFTVAEIEYQAEEGMTWEEWVNSKYNDGTFSIVGNSVVRNAFYYLSGNKADIIEANHNYTFGHSGGAN